MAIRTRLTEFFGLQHPIVLAPMTPAAGADLASAVSEAGGLGLLGGGYAERALFMAEAAKVTRPDVGCGFITWALARDPDLYDEALARFPRAMMLSFADPAPLARRVRDAGVPLIYQVHTLDQALHAVDVGPASWSPKARGREGMSWWPCRRCRLGRPWSTPSAAGRPTSWCWRRAGSPM